MDNAEKPYRVVPMDFARADYVGNIYSCTVVMEKAGLYAYHFEVGFEGKNLRLKKGEDGVGVWEHGWDWQLTVYDPAMRTPAPLREGMFYQIFPDRFCKSGTPKEQIPPDRILRADWGALPIWKPNAEGKMLNNDYFGGDLQGIIEKLPYLQSLGVTILYLNPIFEAHSNHRYNTADYFHVDPLLGTNEDFSRLCAVAKNHGIAIILDGVFSHTGSDSIYFNRERRYGEGGAYNDPDSPYRPWYNFRQYPHDYESWWGFITLPNVGETEPSYLEFICGENGVIRHWLALGAAGFRLDVADELPDEFIDAIHRCIKDYDPDAILLGEVWEDASNKISYGVRRRYLLGGQFDSVMNYPFMNAILSYMRHGSWRDFYGTIMQVLENYPPCVVRGLMNMLSTHDTPRALTQLAGLPMKGNDRDWQEHNHYLPLDAYDRGCRLYALASVLLFGLPGIPCVYYGDESGLSGYRDPFNRVCYPWSYQNTVLIAQISRLGELRRRYPLFGDATFEPMTFTEEVVVFLRRAADVSLLFAVNRSESRERLSLPWEFKDIPPFFLTGDYENGILEPLSGIVLVVE
jgi:glycosidase